jgi:hypothetical protein
LAALVDGFNESFNRGQLLRALVHLLLVLLAPAGVDFDLAAAFLELNLRGFELLAELALLLLFELEIFGQFDILFFELGQLPLTFVKSVGRDFVLGVHLVQLFLELLQAGQIAAALFLAGLQLGAQAVDLALRRR